MKLRTCARFCSTLPEDHIENENGDIVQFGGKSVMAAIAERLARIGCDVGEPIYAHEHGWELLFEAKAGGRFWAQVTLIDDYWLMMEERAFRLFGSKEPSPSFEKLLQHLAEALAADERFSEVRWYTSEDLGTDLPGHARPTGDQ